MVYHSNSNQLGQGLSVNLNHINWGEQAYSACGGNHSGVLGSIKRRKPPEHKHLLLFPEQ